MRVVQDLIFVEQMTFTISATAATEAKRGTWSIAEGVQNACAAIGLELVDYDTVLWHPVGTQVRVELKSRAWRDRWKRIAQMSG
jgi:hypothetical protein